MAFSYDDKVALVNRAYQSWNSRDLDAALEFVHPDVEWVSAEMFPDIEPVYHGHEGVMRFWRDFLEPWESLEIDGERMIEAGEALLVLARFRARGRQGLEVDLRVGQLFTLADDGRVIHFRAFASHDEALRAIDAAGPGT